MPSEYSTPLWRKLGIHEGDRVVLWGEVPGGLEMEGMPDGVDLRRSRQGTADLTVWFVRSAAELRRGLPQMAPRAERSGLWIAWPKRTSPLASDLTDEVVRGEALGAGLVDFKVCAIDGDWSGLRFNRRKVKEER